MTSATSSLHIPPSHDARQREAWVADVEARFTPIASALGILFILVVIGENLASPDSRLRLAFLITGWILWFLFAAEFTIRAVVAPSTLDFFKRNWWQLVFLVLPFLRFIAAFRLARLARAGRIVGSAVRGARSAGQVLRGRLLWIGVVHSMVVLTASQLAYEFGANGVAYGDILHRVGLASVAGEPLGLGTGVGAVLDVLLAVYAVMVFATLAGAVGAYFLSNESRSEQLNP